MRGIATEWTLHDRALAIALQLHEDSLCDGCGQPKNLSFDPDLERAWQVDAPARCHACSAIADAAEDYARDGVKHPHALRFAARLSKHGRRLLQRREESARG